jgi:hypothetical protein
MRQSHGPAGGGATIGIVARGCINVVLINVTKFLIHCITVQ